MAYPINAASPERIAIGAVVQISDGAVQSTGVSVTVRGQGGAEAAGGGTIAYGATGVIVYYTPTQAETNFTSFVVIASKTGCIPVAQTIVTSASGVAGYSGLDWAVVRAPTTTLALTGTTIATTQKVDVETIKTNPVVNAGTVTFPTTATLASTTNITGGTITTTTNLTNLPAITANWLTAAGIAAGALDGKGNWNIGKTGYSLTATTGLGNQTADITGNLSGSVGSVTGLTASNLDATVSSRMATYTQPTGFLAATFPSGTVANTTNITAGTITTVTNLTNAPTSGDLTATMKTSVQTAADAAVTANASIAAIKAPVDDTIVRGTSSATASTTSLTPSAFSPAGVAADQFKGRVLVFDNDTTTTALRGQATTITASSAASLPVLTYTALTTSPASGDTFSLL